MPPAISDASPAQLAAIQPARPAIIQSAPQGAAFGAAGFLQFLMLNLGNQPQDGDGAATTDLASLLQPDASAQPAQPETPASGADLIASVLSAINDPKLPVPQTVADLQARMIAAGMPQDRVMALDETEMQSLLDALTLQDAALSAEGDDDLLSRILSLLHTEKKDTLGQILPGNDNDDPDEDTSAEDLAALMGELPPGAQQPTPELAARLNALSVGGDADKPGTALPSAAPGGQSGQFAPIQQDQSGTADGDARPLDLKPEANLQGKPSPSNTNTGGQQQSGQQQQSQQQSSQAAGVIPLVGFGNWTNEDLTQTFDTEALSLPALTAGLTHPTGTGSVMTQAPSGIATVHPASQTVALVLKQGVEAGQSQSLTLQLDPPELGKVAIRLELNKDKSLKAHLVVEKPETLSMLQRDSAVLERALQEAGLDAGSSDLSFELAHQDANDPSNRDTSGFGERRASGDGETEQSVEASLTASPAQALTIDPETGRMKLDMRV